MNPFHLRPIDRRLIIKVLPQPDKEGILWIPERKRYEYSMTALVIAYAADCKHKWLKGDRVYFSPFQGDPIYEISAEESCRLICEDSILGKETNP